MLKVVNYPIVNIILVFFIIGIYTDLYIQKIILQKRNRITKRYFSRNVTKRNVIFFGTETENRNEINIFQKRNGTERKKNNVF
jgi:hypothetical protein